MSPLKITAHGIVLPDDAAGMVAILAGLAVVFLPDLPAHPETPSPPSGPLPSSPFVNTGGDPEEEYFSDGMTDELAHVLAGLPDIRVAGGEAGRRQRLGRGLPRSPAPARVDL